MDEVIKRVEAMQEALEEVANRSKWYLGRFQANARLTELANMARDTLDRIKDQSHDG